MNGQTEGSAYASPAQRANVRRSASRHSPDRDVLKLLAAAEGIADGLVEITDVIFEADPRWKDALAAANEVACRIADVRREAEQELWKKAEVK